MKAKQYRKAIAKLGLNLTTAADFLGVSYRTSRRCGNIKSEKPVPRLIAFALNAALRLRMTPEQMVDELGD